MRTNISGENIEKTSRRPLISIIGKAIAFDEQGQVRAGCVSAPPLERGPLITPNPEVKLLDQVREVMWPKHQSMRTETAFCDWIRR